MVVVGSSVVVVVVVDKMYSLVDCIPLRLGSDLGRMYSLQQECIKIMYWVKNFYNLICLLVRTSIANSICESLSWIQTNKY